MKPMKVAKSLFSKLGGILLALVLFTGSAFVGSVAFFFYLTGVLPTREMLLPNAHTKLSMNDDDDDNDYEKDEFMSDGREGDRSSVSTDDHIEMTLANAASALDDFEEISASEVPPVPVD